MQEDGLDITELTEFARKFVEKTSKKYPKEIKRFMRSEGNKLKRRIKARAKSSLGTKTGNYMKGFRRGRPYKYNSDEDSIRVYNYMPHAHLIEYGHRIVARGKKGKKQRRGTGKELGFKVGMHIVERTEREFTNEFIANTEKFVDALLEDGLS